MFSKFRNAGQTCVASNRILVQDGIYDKFMDTVVKYVSKEMRCGDGFIPTTTVGPLINKKGLHKVITYKSNFVSFLQISDCLYRFKNMLKTVSIKVRKL